MSEKNHSDFIRKHPKLSVADLIQEGAKQGMDIKKNLIYNVRSKDRKAAGETGAAPTVKKKVSKKPVAAVAKAKAAPTKKVSKKAKVAAAKGTPRVVRAQEAQMVTPMKTAATMRAPVAIVFFDSEALVRGMKEGFPQPVL
jgi:hypothetical protein